MTRTLWIGLALMALAMLPAGSARAQTICHNGNEAVQVGEKQCIDGFMNMCQANGAWVSNRQWPCMEPVFNTAAKSCAIRRNQSAAPGARACINGKRRECGESGSWIDLGSSC